MSEIKKLVVVSIIFIGFAMLIGYQMGQQDVINFLKPVGVVQCESVFYTIYAVDLPYIPQDSTCKVIRLFNQTN